MDERMTPPWRATDAILVAIAAIVATFFVAALFAVTLPSGLAFVLSAFAFEAALAGFTLAWVHYRYRAAIPALRLRSGRPGRDIGFGLVAGVGLYLGVVFAVAPALFALVGLFTGEPVSVPTQEILPDDPGDLERALAGLFVIAAAPIGEEIFFRGLLFSGLRRRFGLWPAGAISGAIFAVFHPPPLLMPLFFAVGVGLAWVYERRGSLLAPIAAHLAFNVIGFSLLVQTS